MSVLTFVFFGNAAEAATDEFKAVLVESDPGLNVIVQQPAALPDAVRKAVDPIALASLIVSIPSFILAVADLADRIKKRRRTQKLIDDANRLRIENNVEIHLLVENVATPLDQITADILLEMASK